MELEITIDVDDLDRAVQFYCGGLGLTLVERNPNWARVELNGQNFWLCAFEAGPHGNVTRDFRRHWTPIHLDFIVDDVDKAVERALAAGGRTVWHPTWATWRSSEALCHAAERPVR